MIHHLLSITQLENYWLIGHLYFHFDLRYLNMILISCTTHYINDQIQCLKFTDIKVKFYAWVFEIVYIFFCISVCVNVMISWHYYNFEETALPPNSNRISPGISPANSPALLANGCNFQGPGRVLVMWPGQICFIIPRDQLTSTVNRNRHNKRCQRW